MNAISPGPIDIDPRPCGLCGLTIDRHDSVDHGEGPEFFCLPPDEMTLPELERRAELIRLVEVAEIMARMEAADLPFEPPPPASAPPYRTPQATIDAFKYVVASDDLPRVRAWLVDRPKDAPYLLALLESKTAC